MLRHATWQVTRIGKRPPAEGTFAPQFGPSIVGTWVGSWCPTTAMIREISDGAPIVDIDMYAFLPAEAGAYVFEGDMLVWMERGTRWEASIVSPFPSRLIIALKTASEKRVNNA
jgi:hypothetical protein